MMCRCPGLVSVAVLAGALLACRAAPVAAAGRPATVDATQLPAGQFQGTLKRAPGTDRMFTVTVSYPEIIATPNVPANIHLQRQIQNVIRLQQQVQRSKRPGPALVQLQKAIIQLQVHAANVQASAFKVRTVTQDVQFQAAEDVKVRTLTLPEAFDDKGKVRKPTAEELKELKGKDSKLPGYESSLEVLSHGQVVQVTLAAHRPPKPAAEEKKAKPDLDKDKDAEVDKKAPGKKGPAPGIEDGEKKMQVRMIVIVKGGDAHKSDSPGGKSP